MSKTVKKMMEVTVIDQDAEGRAKWDKLNTQIEHSGKAIVLPGKPDSHADMDYDTAIEALERKRNDENQEFDFHEVFDAYPMDAAVAFTKAMNNLFGWSSPQTRMTFWGPQRPKMETVKTGWHDDDVVQVPIGDFKIPGVENKITTVFDWNGNNFIAYGTFKRKESHILVKLANEAKRILKVESIYRGRAIKLMVDDNGGLLTRKPPEFMNVNDTTEESLIFDADVQEQVDTNLFTPIKHTDTCRRLGIPLKRTGLLEGQYGVGKTLLARAMANLCEQHSWTFVALANVKGLEHALEFAVRYAPAVVFGEDLDLIVRRSDDDDGDYYKKRRDEITQALTLKMDGILSKGQEVMTILTTNHVEDISPVLLRPGRTDAIISLRAPSKDAVVKLVKLYAGDLLTSGVDLTVTSTALAGMIPASIREAVERAKLGMISRGDNKLADNDLVIAANTMKRHMELLKGKAPEPSNAEKLEQALKVAVNGGGEGGLNGHGEMIEDTNKIVKKIDYKVDKTIISIGR